MSLGWQLRGFWRWRAHLKARVVAFAEQRKFGPADGCSFVPDFDFVDCCNVHDEEYRTHRDATTGEPIEKWQADNKMYECILRKQPPTAWRALIGWIYWQFLKWSPLAYAAWDRWPAPPNVPPP